MRKKTADLRPLIAISKSMPTSVEVLDATLDAWAQMHARETGQPLAKAYDDLLRNDEAARELYAERRKARRDPSIIAERREQLRKRAEGERGKEPVRSDVERTLDELADEHAKGKSITKAAAYDEILRSDEGRELYAKHRAKRKSAA
jgi:hypothetical protein